MDGLTVKEVAERLQVTRARVHQLIWRGQLQAERTGKELLDGKRAWMIAHAEVARWQSVRPAVGRPRKIVSLDG